MIGEFSNNFLWIRVVCRIYDDIVLPKNSLIKIHKQLRANPIPPKVANIDRLIVINIRLQLLPPRLCGFKRRVNCFFNPKLKELFFRYVTVGKEEFIRIFHGSPWAEEYEDGSSITNKIVPSYTPSFGFYRSDVINNCKHKGRRVIGVQKPAPS